MDFAKDTFPLAVYGMQDVFSGYLVYLKVWMSNSNPKLVGRWYLEHLYKSKVISCRLRLDKGTETGIMATIHSFLRKEHEDVSNAADTVQYGPSTCNKIERWWHELHSRLEQYFKRQLRILLEQGCYDPNDQTDRYLLAFVFIPVIQKEMNIFRETVWNSHRIRKQKDAQLPKGIPNHVYHFPEKYGAEDCGWQVSEESLNEVAELSGVLQEGSDFLPQDVRAECERIIPEVHKVQPRDAADLSLSEGPLSCLSKNKSIHTEKMGTFHSTKILGSRFRNFCRMEWSLNLRVTCFPGFLKL